MNKDGRLNGEMTQAPNMPEGVLQQQVRAYGTPYANEAGTTTLYYIQGKPVGYRDYWDFDKKPWGERPISGELKTRVMDAAPGKPFWVEYGIHPR